MKDSEWATKQRANKLLSLWLWTALAGIVAISLTIGIGVSSHATGTERSDSPLFVVIRLLLPVAILLVYARRGYLSAVSTGGLNTLRRARLAQLADSLYFLGFLWTLWALIDSFVIHQLSIAEAVFRAFGYALVTTASGMFLRLLLLQFSYSEEDQVRLADQTVEQEIATFTKEVRKAIESLMEFSAKTNGAMTAWVEALNQSTGNLKVAIDGVTDQSTDLKEALLKMHETSAKHLNSVVEKAFNEFVRKAGPSFEALNTANRDFVSQVNDNTTTMAQTLKSSTAQIQAAANQGVTQAEILAGEGAKRLQAELAHGTITIRGGVEKGVRSMHTATADFENGLSAQMINLKSHLEQLHSRIKEFQIPTGDIERTVSEKLTSLGSALVRSTEAVEKQTTAFAETLAGQTAKLESEIVRVLKQVKEIHGPNDLIEKQINVQLLPLSMAMQSSAKAIEEASSTFTQTITSQKIALESELANLSTRIGEVRVPTEKVEAALETQIAAFDAMLLKNSRIIDAASSDFENTLSRQLPTLTTQLTNLSTQLQHLDSNSNKGRWWLFGR